MPFSTEQITESRLCELPAFLYESSGIIFSIAQTIGQADVQPQQNEIEQNENQQVHDLIGCMPFGCQPFQVLHAKVESSVERQMIVAQHLHERIHIYHSIAEEEQSQQQPTR